MAYYLVHLVHNDPYALPVLFLEVLVLALLGSYLLISIFVVSQFYKSSDNVLCSPFYTQ